MASISTATMSASCAPPHAVVTMARSSRRRGAKMPGVSMNTSCAWPSIAMPRSSVRVVCTLGVTIATLLPTSALISVDLPALGAPISAMKPQRVSAGLLGVHGLLIHRHDPSARLRARAWRPRRPARPRASSGRPLRPARVFGNADRDAELRIVVRPGALDLRIGRRRQAARLRPFLQDGLWIAQRPHRRPHPLAPQPFDQLGGFADSRRREHRADQRLAHVGEDRGATAGRRRWPPKRRAEAPRRDRSRAPRPHRSRAAPDRPAAATARPRRPWERRETACRR